MTACARSVKSPVTLRELLWPRATGSGSRIAPLTPSTLPLVMVSASTRWRNLNVSRPRFFRLAGAPLERLDDAGAGAPGDVEPRHRIAVAHGVIAAALGPADHRKNPVAHRPQPAAFLAGGESEIGLRPAPRPEVFIAVEARRAHPVLQRQLVTVLDAEPALLGRIDQKQPAERPERLAAKALFAFLIDHDDALAGVRDLGRGDEAGEARADHDDVSFVCHRVSPGLLRIIEARDSGVVNGKTAA